MEATYPILEGQYTHTTTPHGVFPCTTLFVDISGFTPLTESFMQQAAEGADKLSSLLNSLFQPIVSQVYAQGGYITHFAGDAFTAIFGGNEAEKALNLSFFIRHFFNSTPSVSNTKIQVRVGLSFGLVEWGLVGEQAKTLYFKGSAIERATLAQKSATPNQIVADKWFLENLDLQDIDIQSINAYYFVLEKKDINENFKNSPILDPFVDIQKWTEIIQNRWINEKKGEFREITALFMSFSDLNRHDTIHSVANIVLKAFENFGGYFKEIDFSEKNGVMVGFWGAPISYENDAERALECALAIEENIKTYFPDLVYQFGISKGKAFTGVVGGKERNQYAAVGSKVNLAARLMQNADTNEIWVSQNLTHLTQFEIEEQGVKRIKGFSKSIPVYKLLRKKQEKPLFFKGEMIGREKDLAWICDFIQQHTLEKQEGGIIHIFGEAGVGKSRLLFEAHQHFDKKEVLFWVNCPTDQILRKPFNPFIYFLKNYFQQQLEASDADNKTAFNAVFETLLSQNTEGVELKRTHSILAALIGLYYENSLWEQLDAKGRYDNTLYALQHFFIALSNQKPLVIELEDAHWLDEDSAIFLKDFIKKIVNKPIAVLISARYDDEGKKSYLLAPPQYSDAQIPFLDIDLNIFTKENLENLAQHKLIGTIHPELVETLWRTSNGNPFYAEQILDYFIENNILHNIDNQWLVRDKRVKISNSVSAILTARIDRLSHILKETIKAAAVIGREFELPILTEVLSKNDTYIKHNGNSQAVLQEQIQSAEKGQIWQAMNELRYIFRHTLLREAVYDMQLKTQLKDLHATTAKAIEKLYIDKLEDRYIDLAFHYEQAEMPKKACFYLKKAADSARRLFQNQQALDLYERLLKNTDDPAEIIKTEIRRGEVLQLIGQWQEAEKQYKDALSHATDSQEIELKGRSNNALGQLLMLKGNYKEASYHLERAADCFEKIIDFQGIVRVYGNMGNLYFRQGVYDKAQDYFTRSISYAREHGVKNQAQVVANLGLTYMNQGKYTEGVACQKEELNFCEKEGDIVGMAILSVNLGIVWMEEGNRQIALKYLETGLSHAQKLGNKQLISIALGCIGSIWLEEKNTEQAEKYLLQDLTITEELGDKQGIAIASELLGRLHIEKKLYDDALSYFDISLNICRSLNYQKGIAKTLMGMGKAYEFKQEKHYAVKCFDEAYNIAVMLQNMPIIVSALMSKGIVLKQYNDVVGMNTIRELLGNQSENLENAKIKEQITEFLLSF